MDQKNKRIYKLTQKIINNLQPKKKQYFCSDITPGLSLCVYPTGRKIWKLYRKTLANAEFTTPDQARKMVKKSLYNNPKRPKKEKKPIIKPAATENKSLEYRQFGALITAWLDTHRFDDAIEKNRKMKTRAKGNTRIHLLPKLGHLPIVEIDEIILENIFIDMIKAGKRDSAGRCRKILKDFFNHMVRKNIIRFSPCHTLEKMNFIELEKNCGF